SPSSTAWRTKACCAATARRHSRKRRLLRCRGMDEERDRPNFFAGPYIDRRAELRESADWREAALSDASTLYVVSRGTTHLLVSDPEPRIAFVSREHRLVVSADESRFVLLGWFRGTRCVLIETNEDDGDAVPDLPGSRFEELRPLTNVLP